MNGYHSVYRPSGIRVTLSDSPFLRKVKRGDEKKSYTAVYVGFDRFKIDFMVSTIVGTLGVCGFDEFAKFVKMMFFLAKQIAATEGVQFLSR